MKILAIETSCETGSIALRVGDRVTERTLPGSGAGHSASVLPVVRELLDEASLPLGELDVVAFGAGPGAFTGSRLACGIAQGLALGADLPVAPVSSLRALASAQSAQRIYCALDARMGEIYLAAYLRIGPLLREDIAPQCVPPGQAPLPVGSGWIGVGTGFGAYPVLGELLGAQVKITEPAAVPRASAVSLLAADRSLWIDPALAAPVYVRDKVALTVAERMAAGGRA